MLLDSRTETDKGWCVWCEVECDEPGEQFCSHECQESYHREHSDWEE